MRKETVLVGLFHSADSSYEEEASHLTVFSLLHTLLYLPLFYSYSCQHILLLLDSYLTASCQGALVSFVVIILKPKLRTSARENWPSGFSGLRCLRIATDYRLQTPHPALNFSG
jgi:hypothetical protein